MAKRSSRARSIALPWERRGAWLRELFAGRRWKVLLAVSLLGLALLVVARSAERRERERETRAAISKVKRSIGAFRNDMGRCPHNLHELMHPPRSGRRYLRHVPTDGWGRAFFVRCPARYDPEGADVISAGPSGDFLEDDNVL
ncbi:MAG: type II secretion system protein GspG [Sandaracinaceae bacterium]